MTLTVTTAGGASFTGAQFHQARTGYQDLGKALQSGDLDAAKAAYDQMTSAGNGRVAAQFPHSPVALVGKALDNGNLAGAQKAYDAMFTRHSRGTTSPGDPLPPAPVTESVGRNLNVVA